ncbi:MAG: hypothetical protein WAV25_01555 [Minisyncoccia bacterium]
MGKEELFDEVESQERTPSQEEMDAYVEMENLFLRRHLAEMRINPSIDRQPAIDDWMRIYSGAFQIAFSNLVRKNEGFIRRCQTGVENTNVLEEIEAEFKKVKKTEGLE